MHGPDRATVLAPWRAATGALAALAAAALAASVTATPAEPQSLHLSLLFPGLLFLAALITAAGDRKHPNWRARTGFASAAAWGSLAAALLLSGLEWFPRAITPMAANAGSFAPPGAVAAGLFASIIAWIRPGQAGAFALAAACLAALAGTLSGSGLPAAILGATFPAAAMLLVLTHFAGTGRIPPPGSVKLTGFARIPALISRMPGRSPDPGHSKRLFTVLTLLLAAYLLFFMVPGIDLRISGLFYDDTQGFLLNHTPRLQELRGVFEAVIFLLALVPLALWLHALRDPEGTRIPRQIWAFAAFAMLLGPGVLANLILKENWGRARPAEITEFGGTAQFTLPFEISDQCARNCSFVSGEGSGIAMAAIVLLTLAWPAIRHRPWPWLLAVCLPAAGGIALRIVKGRHFFSDTVFAILLMALVAVVLYRWLDIGRHREKISARALLDDAAAMLDYLWPGARDGSLWRDLKHLARAVPVALTAVLWQGGAETDGQDAEP